MWYSDQIRFKVAAATKFDGSPLALNTHHHLFSFGTTPLAPPIFTDNTSTTQLCALLLRCSTINKELRIFSTFKFRNWGCFEFATNFLSTTIFFRQHHKSTSRTIIIMTMQCRLAFDSLRQWSYPSEFFIGSRPHELSSEP